MGKEVSSSQIESYRKAFEEDPAAKVAQNAVSNTELTSLALSRDLIRVLIKA